MQNYATPQPIDRYSNLVGSEQASATPALQVNVSGALVSSIIALDGRATVVEIVTANAGSALIKWFGSVIGANPTPSVTTAAFDNAVPPNWIRRFVIPQSVAGVTSSGSIVGGFGSQNGLYTQLAVMNLQAGTPTSIVVSQY